MSKNFGVDPATLPINIQPGDGDHSGKHNAVNAALRALLAGVPSTLADLTDGADVLFTSAADERYAQAGALAAVQATVPYRPYVYDVRSFIQAGETLAADGVSAANNSVIIQRAIDTLTAAYAADGQPRQVFIPNGRYKLSTNGTDSVKNTKWALRIKTGVGIIGESTTGTVLLGASDSTVVYGAYGSPTAPLTDCLFQTFTIDGAAQTNATYTTQLKGMFIQYLLRPRWDRVAIRNTWATGLGCDFLVDYRIDGHISDGCGRGIREKALDPLTVSGGSGIGLGTGYTQDERGVINGAILTNNGKNGLFYETQTSVTFHSRGHSVVGGVSAGNHTGLHDCGCDGLEVTGMQLVDNLYAGLLLAGTVLEPNAGFNGRFNGTIARNGSAATSDSGGVVIGSLPTGRYVVEGVIQGNAGHGVVSKSDANVGPGLRINADIRDNGGAGVFIGTTSTTPIKSLTIGGRILSNGRNTSIARREGVVIAAYTKGLTVSGVISDDQDNPTQQVGLLLRDSSAVGRTTVGANLSADVRGNVTGFVNQTILSGTNLVLVGVSSADPTGLSASGGAASGAVDLAWTAPADTTGITDYAIQYRQGTTGSWLTFSHTASTTTAIRVTGLTNGAPHQFQVAAVRSGANTGFTAVASATPSDPAVIPVLADNFTGSGTLAGRALPDGSTTSKTWSVASSTSDGAFGIVGNAAKPTAGISATFATVDYGAANYRLEATFPALLADTTKRRVGIVFRYTDATNWWRLTPNDGTWKVQKDVAGTVTTVITGPTAGAGDVVALTVVGNAMSLTVNGAAAGTNVTGQTDLASSTLVGITGQFNSSGGGALDQTSTMDAFKVYAA